jgi:hypothetical protein
MRNYWTPERDEELKRHEAAGLSASQIAVLLHTTRSAVIGRSNRLRGNLFQSDVKRLQRSGIATTTERADTAILATLRDDLAAGIARDVVIKRALSAGIKRAAVGEYFGLSIAQVYQIAGPRQDRPRWTKEQEELLLTMWPRHSSEEIADALGTTSRAVDRKRWRMGLWVRNRRKLSREAAPQSPE